MSIYTLETTQPSLRALANGLEFPEGPVALPDGSVVLVEIASGWLTRVAADGTKRQLVHLDAGPNGAAIGPGGRLFVCNNGGFAWHRSAEHGLRPIGQAQDYSGGRIEAVDLASGHVECLYTQSDSGPLKGPNDLVFDRHGGFWFTDHGKVRPREVDRGSVCYALADGSAIRETVFPLWSPNGIGLSPDEKTLYVAETFTGRLWAFDIGEPGHILARPWPDSPNGGRLLCRLPGMQNIDSLAVDAQGNICLATLGEGGITVVSPAGQVLHRVELPDPMTTNICFGGKYLKTAFVTLSSTGRLVALDWPCPGLPLNFLNR